MLVLSHVISWMLPAAQISPPFGCSMVSVGSCAQYRPPVLRRLKLFPSPPQTIISLPVHTAVWAPRGVGALFVLVAIQLSVLGSYLPPVFKTPPLLPLCTAPPQTIISLRVHTAV